MNRPLREQKCCEVGVIMELIVLRLEGSGSYSGNSPVVLRAVANLSHPLNSFDRKAVLAAHHRP